MLESVLALKRSKIDLDPAVMKKFSLVSLAGGALSLLIAGGSIAQAESMPRVEVGILDCAVAGGTGYVFGSTKDLSCTFTPADDTREDEQYFGVIMKYGLDVGSTDGGVIKWAVLSPTIEDFKPGALEGDYRGVTAEATVGAGVGTNALVGGSLNTFTLQPLSLTTQTGLNLAVTVSEIEIRSPLD